MPLSYNKFTTALSTKEDVLKYALTQRDLIIKELGILLKESELREDNIRIEHTINFLIDVENDFEFYIANKPPTRSCEEAAKFRVNHEKILRREENPFGIKAANETKSIVRKRGDALYFFIMPGDRKLDEKIASQLPAADLSRLGVIEFTVNPATILSASDKVVHIFQHQELNGEFLSNNLGSKFLSYAISQEHYQKALAKLCGSKKCEVNIYDGQYDDFVKKAGLNPAGSIYTRSGFSQLAYGDHYRSLRE